MAAAQGALDAVPEGASVETDTTLLARLVPGREVYWVGTTGAMDTPPGVCRHRCALLRLGRPSTSTPSRGGVAAHPGHTYETIYSKRRASASRGAPRNAAGAAQSDAPAERHPCVNSYLVLP